ncbi:MAG TPA: hypothetical protein VHM93_18490 [Candidatus Acidoferrum sp.]|nr:hypothetical protein [Candidatus Acidoferrum sp.]
MAASFPQRETKSVVAKRSVQVSVLLWIACIAAIFPLSHGKLPFSRPALAGASLLAQVILQAISPLPPLLLMGVTYLLTRRRTLPDVSSRAPAASTALRETLVLWLYGACVLGIGQLLGRRLFGEGIGLHLNGSLFGPTRVQTPQEVWTWSAYNFVFYAVAPYLFFRRRGYSREALNLKSSNVRNDALVIFVILALESALEFAGKGGLGVTHHQFMIGGLISFVVHLFGTGLPVMIFIYSILFPRYLRLTGSGATTVLLGALSYAALHVFEYWTVYDSLPHTALSVIFVVTTFFGPGLIKSYLTLRTGNAWVHLWAYHAIAPHVTSDTPIVVKIFGLR